MNVATADTGVLTLQFDEFFRTEYAPVYRAAFLSSGSREVAEDVAQEAFARAFARWKRLRSQPWAGGWVMTTALNLCKRHHKRRADASVAATSGVDVRNRSDAGLDLARALQKLPMRQRTAVTLFYLGDLPLGQIAHLMQISEGAVKAHLAEARAALRGSLEVADD